jgi:hypothetical protein
MTESNTTPEVANTAPAPKTSMDAYAEYISRTMGGMDVWKSNALPPSQTDVAVSIGKISKDKE